MTGGGKKVWLILIGLVVACEAGSAIWRFVAESIKPYEEADMQLLELRIPEEKDRLYEEIEINPKQVAGLSFDHGSRYFRDLGEGRQLDLLYLKYEAGNRFYFDDIYCHSAEICMAASGAEVSEVYPMAFVVGAGEERLHLESVCTVSQERNNSYIFRATWRAQAFRFAFAKNRFDRLLNAFSPPPPALVLMGSVHGAGSVEEAREIFLENGVEMLQVIQPESP